MLTYASQMTPFNDIHLCRGYSVSCLPRVRSTCHWLLIMSHHLSQLWNREEKAAPPRPQSELADPSKGPKHRPWL